MLLTEDMIDIFIIDGENERDVGNQISEFLEKTDTLTISTNNTMKKDNPAVPSVRISCPIENNIEMDVKVCIIFYNKF